MQEMGRGGGGHGLHFGDTVPVVVEVVIVVVAAAAAAAAAVVVVVVAVVVVVVNSVSVHKNAKKNLANIQPF